jgi:hypothetical protein
LKAWFYHVFSLFSRLRLRLKTCLLATCSKASKALLKPAEQTPPVWRGAAMITPLLTPSLAINTFRDASKPQARVACPATPPASLKADDAGTTISVRKLGLPHDINVFCGVNFTILKPSSMPRNSPEEIPLSRLQVCMNK